MLVKFESDIVVQVAIDNCFQLQVYKVKKFVHTCLKMTPQKKSHMDRSGECGDHARSPNRDITHSGNTT